MDFRLFPKALVCLYQFLFIAIIVVALSTHAQARTKNKLSLSTVTALICAGSVFTTSLGSSDASAETARRTRLERQTFKKHVVQSKSEAQNRVWFETIEEASDFIKARGSHISNEEVAQFLVGLNQFLAGPFGEREIGELQKFYAQNAERRAHEEAPMSVDRTMKSILALRELKWSLQDVVLPGLGQRNYSTQVRVMAIGILATPVFDYFDSNNALTKRFWSDLEKIDDPELQSALAQTRAQKAGRLSTAELK